MSILRMEELETSYERHKVFEGLNLEIKPGLVTTVIGPNGCGKSTLLKTISRIIKQRQGKVFLQGEDLSKIPTREVAKKMALLTQNPSAPAELTVEDLISYGRYPHRKNGGRLTSEDREAIEAAMEMTQTLSFRDRPLGNLSGGQRQKVWLAMALAQETDILLLDEPTTYLDMAHQLDVLKIVEELNIRKKCTIVMVLHDLNHAARFSHEMVAMKEGKIIARGTPKEIMTKNVLRSVFQIEARLIDDQGVPVCIGYESVLSDTACEAEFAEAR
ncbi:ABC transporter ATP-binding protein [Bacillus massiliglaciei]|uniref:ABC transporter ATP-binding protein n=1 Tax=Bacillus massiliglaciei TaxID=1816693 RepID=UPI000A5C81DA|nr:ABC transporter ATP-binding protein [Bacillus massiliglaciei]